MWMQGDQTLGFFPHIFSILNNYGMPKWYLFNSQNIMQLSKYCSTLLNISCNSQNMVQLLEIYHTAQEGCIFLGNMYNDLRAAMGWFVMATNRRYCVYYGTTPAHQPTLPVSIYSIRLEQYQNYVQKGVFQVKRCISSLRDTFRETCLNYSPDVILDDVYM